MRASAGRSPHRPPTPLSGLAQNLQSQPLVKVAHLGTLEWHVWRGGSPFTWDCYPEGFANWLQECMGPPVTHILLFRLTTSLNKLALTLVTNLIISLCSVIVLSDSPRPVLKSQHIPWEAAVGAHLLPERLPFLYCAI